MQIDPIGYTDSMNLYTYVGNNPVVLTDPSGTNIYGGYISWLAGYGFNTNVDMGWSEAKQLGLAEAVGAGKGAIAELDGAIPFADPFKGVYAGPGGNVEGVYKFSQAMGGVARDAWLAAAIPNIGAWAKNPIKYEIGSKTLPTAEYTRLGLDGLNAVQKGERIIQAYGSTWKAAKPCFELAPYLKTVPTGLTPGGYLFGIGALEVADRRYNSYVSKSSYNSPSYSSYNSYSGSKRWK